MRSIINKSRHQGIYDQMRSIINKSRHQGIYDQMRSIINKSRSDQMRSIINKSRPDQMRSIINKPHTESRENYGPAYWSHPDFHHCCALILSELLHRGISESHCAPSSRPALWISESELVCASRSKSRTRCITICVSYPYNKEPSERNTRRCLCAQRGNGRTQGAL
jgi:hypothetical protein